MDTPRMKISILVHDLSGNCLVRTYPIAKVLQRHYEVEVIGPAFDGDIFAPYRDEFVYKVEGFPEEWWQTQWRRRLCSLHKAVVKPCRMITGDVLYAFKPRPASFGTGLIAHWRKKRPLVLDIEDWEAEDYFSASARQKCRKLLQLGDPKNCWYARWLETLAGLASERTVVSSFLQERFGGIRLPHGADCSFFDPSKHSGDALRQQFEVEGKKVVLFTGKASPHKGLVDLAQAVRALGDPSIVIMVVGPTNGHLEDLLREYEDCVLWVPPQPHCMMPPFLSLADLVVLPQRSTPYAEAQVPGKVYEAMAMAKPIIATEVSDLPEILGGCGWITPPSDPQSLAEAMAYVLRHPDQAEDMGDKARKKCLQCYSWDAMEKILLKVFKRYE
jgi:glycosyltransferase involved in cell wall biosynthesis